MANANASLGNVHTLHQDDPFTINYEDHEARTDSALYVASRKALNKIVQTVQPFFYGEGPYQDHHGGGLWLHDDAGWFFVKNLAGMEWASQFCADPAKVDELRKNASRLYKAFPKSLVEFKALGLDNLDQILSEPITDAAGVTRWTDSIFNASVPLNQARHTGVLPKGDGVHHYPTPVTDIDLIKKDDFTLWVTDEEGQPAAVTPLTAKPEEDRARVVYSTPGTKLSARHQQARQAGEDIVLAKDHPMAKAAFAQRVRNKAAKG